jgi:hypothetical protein
MPMPRLCLGLTDSQHLRLHTVASPQRVPGKCWLRYLRMAPRDRNQARARPFYPRSRPNAVNAARFGVTTDLILDKLFTSLLRRSHQHTYWVSSPMAGDSG